MPHKRKKLRLRVDADLIDPLFLKALRSLKNVRVETVKGRVPDKTILVEANSSNYHIITKNYRDFFKLFRNQTLRIGVIAINTKVPLMEIIPKIVKLLRLLGHVDVYNRFYEVSNVGCRVYHRRGTEKRFVRWRNIKNVLSN